MGPCHQQGDEEESGGATGAGGAARGGGGGRVARQVFLIQRHSPFQRFQNYLTYNSTGYVDSRISEPLIRCWHIPNGDSKP